jgi:hypothetical protein
MNAREPIDVGFGMCAAMSANGTKQTSISTPNMSAIGGKADFPDRQADVR